VCIQQLFDIDTTVELFTSLPVFLLTIPFASNALPKPPPAKFIYPYSTVQYFSKYSYHLRSALVMAVSVDRSVPAVSDNSREENEILSNGSTAAPRVSPKTSLDTKNTSRTNSADATAEFTGDVDTDNVIPSLEMLRNVQDFTVLDKDGKSRPFKSIYSGPNVARRVLVIFVRHFFCGVNSACSLRPIHNKYI
jgi:hypothetical protein